MSKTRTHRGAGRPAPSELPLDEQVAAAREVALRLLGSRERSSADLRTKLRAKGYSAEAVTRVLERLAEAGVQSDARFAEGFVRAAGSRGTASRRIAQDLRARGIDRETAAVAATASPEEDARRARELVARRAGGLGHLADEVRARRLTGLLLRRGFSVDLAREVVSEVVQEAFEDTEGRDDSGDAGIPEGDGSGAP